MKTSELKDLALDWAVTSIEDPDALEYGVGDWREQRRSKTKNGEYIHRYHQSWGQGGPIIEANTILLDRTVRPDGVWDTSWKARMVRKVSDGWASDYGIGSSPLIAAMRCYVASRLGDEVEIPEELS